MAQLVPVDIDPFAAASAQAGPAAGAPTLVPVDHDPFASTARPLTVTPDSFDPEGTGRANYDTGPDTSSPGQRAMAPIGGAAAAIPFADRAAAGLRTMFDDKGYSDNLNDIRSEQAGREAANPAAFRAGEFAAGASMPMGAAGMAVEAPTLLGKAAMGAGLGAGIGGVQGLSSTPDLTQALQAAKDTGKGAGLGALAGAAVPAAGSAVGSIARALLGRSEAVPGMGNDVRDILGTVIEADGPKAVHANLMRLGDPGMLMDAGPSLKGVGQGLALRPGNARTDLVNALTARNDRTNQRVGSAIDGALGPAQSPQAFSDSLAAQRSAIHATLPDVYDAAPPVDVSPVVDQINRRLDSAVGQQENVLTNARKWITDQVPGSEGTPAVPPQRTPVTDPRTGAVIRYQFSPGSPGASPVPPARVPISDPATLANAKTELDGLINHGNPTLGVTPGGVSKAQGAAADTRGGINATLRTQVPGYADAMDQSSALARQMEAIDNGTKSLGSGLGATRPDDFARQWAAMSPEEQAAFRVGMRGTVDQALGTKANDLQALKGVTQGDNGWNAQKLGTAFGEPSARAVNRTVDNEGTMRETYNHVVQGSQTALRDAGKDFLKDAVHDPWEPLPNHLGASHIGGMAAELMVRKPVNALARAMQPPVDNTLRDLQLSGALSAQGPAAQKTLADVLLAHAAAQSNDQLQASFQKYGALAAALMASGGRALLDAHQPANR